MIPVSFINPSQRGSQLVSSALQEIALFSQEVNQNVMEVVNAPIATRNDNVVEALGVKRKRGRPPKNSTQEPASNNQPSQAKKLTPPSRTGLRSQEKK